ncbi:MAG: hypothetical protein O7C61_10225 [SAR324 cluster bacterium]|nr:hypothetical protein [SAR324 cluster bacterium]
MKRERLHRADSAQLHSAASARLHSAASARLHSAAIALLEGAQTPAQAARVLGFDNASTFSQACEKRFGLTPQDLRGIPAAGSYRFRYGGPMHLPQLLAYLGRDPHNLSEQLRGNCLRRHFPLDGHPVPVTLTFEEKSCEVKVGRRLRPAQTLELHGMLRHFLGLDQPLHKFYRLVRGHPVMGPLIKPLRGVRIAQVPTLWEALSWAVMGQQINLSFAYRLRNRLIELGNGGGRPAGKSRRPLPFPTPQAVLGISPQLLRENQFSRQKTDYLAIVARACLEGPLRDLSLDSVSVEEAEARLLGVKGIGRWTMAYGLMRHLGHVDALPVGDAGLRAALRVQFGLSEPPDVDEQERLMEPFRPYRGLATYYLWRSKSASIQE